MEPNSNLLSQAIASSDTLSSQSSLLRAQAEAAIARADELDNSVTHHLDNQSDNKRFAADILDKFKPHDLLTFQKVGNAYRYRELRAILVPLLSVADGSAEHSGAIIAQTIAKISEGLTNILLADDRNNPFGWQLIEEFRTDPLIESADEEKRLRKAKKRLLEHSQSKKKSFGPNQVLLQLAPSNYFWGRGRRLGNADRGLTGMDPGRTEKCITIKIALTLTLEHLYIVNTAYIIN